MFDVVIPKKDTFQVVDDDIDGTVGCVPDIHVICSARRDNCDLHHRFLEVWQRCLPRGLVSRLVDQDGHSTISVFFKISLFRQRAKDTNDIYRINIKNHIKPALGAVRLTELHPHTVQGFVNGLTGLSPATVRLVHGVLHMALEKAVDLDYLPRNPAGKCTLPKAKQEEPRPLDDEQAAALLQAVRGGNMEHLITVALFTGLRLSELLGLTWDAIDYDKDTISINKQLSRQEDRAAGLFQSPKSGKFRTIHLAPAVFATLKRQWRRQLEMQLRAGPLWSNPHGLVFTVEEGGPVNQWKAEKGFRVAAAAAGLTGFHFHCLRHPNVKPKTKYFLQSRNHKLPN